MFTSSLTSKFKSMALPLYRKHRLVCTKKVFRCYMKHDASYQGKHFRYNKKQSLYRESLDTKKKTMVIAVGPSGTGKTSIACSTSLERLIDNQITKIVVTRPMVSTGNEMGFLPGTMENKMDPWLTPLYDNFLDEINKKSLEEYIHNNAIEICPLAYIRGRTFSSCWIIADEMQNSTSMEMKTLLTRVGENSKIIVTGDLDQCDLRQNGQKNGLQDLIEKVKEKNSNKHTDIVTFDIDDVQRSDFVKYVLKLYG